MFRSKSRYCGIIPSVRNSQFLTGTTIFQYSLSLSTVKIVFYMLDCQYLIFLLLSAFNLVEKDSSLFYVVTHHDG